MHSDDMVVVGKNKIEVPKEKADSILKLSYQDTYIINFLKPFNFRYTLWKPSHFYTGLEVHSQNVSWRSFRICEDLFIIAKMYMSGDSFCADIFSNRAMNQGEHNAFRKRLVYSYGLQEENYLELDMLGKIDSELIDLYGMRISCPENFFEISIISLILQNTTIKRTTEMLSLMLDFYGGIVECDGIVLKVFFTPSNIITVSETELRSFCKLGYRAKYVKNFAIFFSENSSKALAEMDQETLLSSLQTIKGVGSYTSNVIASHIMRSTTSVPLDCWNRKILGDALYQDANIDSQELMAKISNDYKEISGVIALYIIENKFKKYRLNRKYR